jgi:PilZ domain-containing protein
MCGHHFFVRQPGKIYSPEEDKREYVRVRVQCLLTFTGKDIEGDGQLIDLSLRGCGMETNVVPSRGQVMRLTLRMPDGRNPLDIEAAVIRYVQGSRVGVEFLRIAEKPEAELRDFVQERLRRQSR